LQWSCTSERKFKRNTEKMSFVITCRTWKTWFQEKENKKKEELAKLESKKEREKNKWKRTQHVNIVLKKREYVLTALRL
jgi:hypothetical protein